MQNTEREDFETYPDPQDLKIFDTLHRKYNPDTTSQENLEKIKNLYKSHFYLIDEIRRMAQIDGEERLDKNKPRIPITDKFRKEVPYTPIATLHIVYEDRELRLGTGFLIGGRKLVTAAHNLVKFVRDNPIKAVKILVCPGRIKNLPLFGVARAVVACVTHDYLKGNQKERQQHDFGLIILNEDLSELAGNLDTTAVDKNFFEKNLKGSSCTVIGYDQISNRLEPSLPNLYEENGEVREITLENNEILYFLNTEKGQSGSPILVKNGSSWLVCGVHVGTKINYKEKSKLNRGILFTERVRLQLRKMEVKALLNSDEQEFKIVTLERDLKLVLAIVGVLLIASFLAYINRKAPVVKKMKLV